MIRGVGLRVYDLGFGVGVLSLGFGVLNLYGFGFWV
jgi:hypothetical protein